jgi:hypothetical protein
MLEPRTLKILGLILAAYVLLLAPGFFWPAYLDSPVGILLLVPMLSIYLFHSLGVPGLLQNNGLCGWGWCSPTWFGWAFLMVAWVMVAWGISRGVAALTNEARHKE